MARHLFARRRFPLVEHPHGDVARWRPQAGQGRGLRRFGEIFDGFDAQYLEPGEIAIDGARTIVTVHTRCRHRLSGGWLNTRKQHIWHIEDGWPVDLSEVYDLAQFEAFMKDAGR
ncbi:MAG TPA: hypothetical protein VK984_01950 [Methyloceanibacter sp.]|nr:hypothetical protein [Methyloceanibacter sp.]